MNIDPTRFFKINNQFRSAPPPFTASPHPGKLKPIQEDSHIKVTENSPGPIHGKQNYAPPPNLVKNYRSAHIGFTPISCQFVNKAINVTAC